MGEKCEKPCSVFGLRPSVSFCSASASAKNFHFGASLLKTMNFLNAVSKQYVK